MRILYGAVGEGLGHATRSRVVAQHLLEQGHEVKMVASGRAFPYLHEHLPDVEEIWGLSFVLEQGEVQKWKTFSGNVRGGRRGIPADWHRGSALARDYDPDLVLSDFDGFAHLFARSHRKPVISIGNIQMVDRCVHDAELLRGIRKDYYAARAFVHAKLYRANHYVITTFFRPPLRLARTTLVPSILRPEILAVRPAAGEHLLVYGRISDVAIAALEASGLTCFVYGAREGLTEAVPEGNLVYRPFANEGFIEDLATCRGVVASAGYSLMSEAVYLRKPMLALPLAGQFEQEMNARYLERLRYGVAASALDAASLGRFLEREHDHVRALDGYEQDGNVVTLATVDRIIDDVMATRT